MKNLFAERIEEKRADRTQKDFAHLLGVPLNTYTNWVRGIRDPSSEWLIAICTRLGVSADWLLGLSDDADAQAQRVRTARPPVPSHAAEPGAYERPQSGDAYWRDLVASQQTTIATLSGLLSAGRSSTAAPARTGGRAAIKSA